MIKSKKDLNFYLQQDRIVNGYNKINIVKQILFPHPIYSFIKTLRYLEYYQNVPSLKNKILKILYKIKFRRLSLKLGFSIPTNVFGPGLSIPHYGTIVVNANAKVGSNCRLHACVNIGASGGSKKAPIIGDNVYIGPGTILFGDIEIVNNVTIGANATVNKSFNEEYCVLAGTPAKIVKRNMPNWLDFNKVFRLE